MAGFARTPIGALGGVMSQVPAQRLATATILKALERSQIDKHLVDALILGQSFSTGCGPLPLQRILIASGLSMECKTHLVNNLCCSGMDAVTLGFDLIQGGKDVCIVGGVENMSLSPFYLRNVRNEKYDLGNNYIEDSLLSDGYDYVINKYELKKNNHLELFCRKYEIPRVDLDEYTINSFRRTANAYNENLIQQELFPLVIKKKERYKKGNERGEDANASTSVGVSISGMGFKGEKESTKTKQIIEEDELYTKYDIDKICNLNSETIVTNYNTAPFGDGACILILISEDRIKELQIEPFVEIIHYEHTSVYPLDFPLSISHSILKCLKGAGKNTVDYFEINESSALNVLYNIQKLQLDTSIVNLNGGSLSLGNPTAVSGARILISLITVLKNYDMSFGCASIGTHLGTSTSLIIENV